MPKLIRVRTRNNDFQHFEVLKRNREKRTRAGVFLIEGVRSINAAIKFGWNMHSFIYAAGRPLSNWAQEVLADTKAEFHYELADELLAEISDKEETSEILAIAYFQPDDIRRIPINDNALVVVFDRPISPGNLGSSLRSCDALGVSGVLITGHAADLYDPVTVRASTGSFFALPVVRLDSAKEVFAWRDECAKSGLLFQVLAADENGTVSLESADFRKPTILVMGNETSGVSKAYRENATQLISIPMVGSASSLNVSCATSILLYESIRQRRS